MDKLLTTQQVADALGLHIKTLQKRLRENEIALSFVQLSPRKVGFKPSEVARYIDLHEIRRDGRGLKKRAKRTTKVRFPVEFMTDAEAQAFFEGVMRDPDGVLESSIRD
jgi:predicted DNA-binding transcriptional regulator AlpA